jgi:peptidoglycan/LPS O-acetylase OafA/YrhL
VVSATPDGPGRLSSLTGLRFLAAFGVFVYHASTMMVFSAKGVQGDWYAYLAENLGFTGVSFFFVLSGFVLTWSARPGGSLSRFWRRRLFKIFPNHVVMFVVALVLYAATTTSFSTGALNLFLLHAWVPDPATFLSVNYPSWSLSCELLFYILFPALLALLSRIRPSRLWWYAGATVVAVFCMPLLSRVLPATPAFLAGDETQSIDGFWFVYIFPPVRLLEFVLGILMARIFLSGKWIDLPARYAALLLVACYTAGLFLPFLYNVSATTAAPLALLIAATATLDLRGKRSLMRNPVMRALGEVSFAFYMVHYVLIFYVRGQGISRGEVPQLLSVPAGVGLILLWLLGSLAGAGALYLAVERPIMRNWASGRRGRRAGGPGEESGVVPEGGAVHPG